MLPVVPATLVVLAFNFLGDGLREIRLLGEETRHPRADPYT